MKRKLLSVLLTFCLAFSLLPTAALAEGEGAPAPAEVPAAAGIVLPEAADGVITLDNGAYVMSGDTTATIKVPNGKNATLDLNGKTLTNKTGEHTIIVENGATLTITGNGIVDNVSHGKAAVYNEGTVTLAGGTFKRSVEKGTYSPYSGNGNSWYTIANYGTMEINTGVTVENAGGYSSMIRNGSDRVTANCYLTIKGGNFAGGINTVKNDRFGVLTINGGNFSNTAQYVIMNWNKAEITAGTFQTLDTASAVLFTSAYDSDANTVGNLTISGGEFKRASDTQEMIVDHYDASNSGTATVTGGKFDADISTYVPDGYIQNENGAVETLGETNAVAKVGGTYYKTLADAVAAAQDGDTITLLKDCSSERVNLESKSITIDLNGNTLTSTSAYGVMFCAKNGHKITVNGTKEGSKLVGTLMVTNGTDGHIEINGGTYESSQYCPIYINGSVSTDNSTLTVKNATITASNSGSNQDTGCGVYLAGYSTSAFENTTVTAPSTGIEIRAGRLTLTNCNVTGGSGKVTADANGNGTTVKNAALAISQHTTKKPIDVTINGGTFTGTAPIYQTDVQGTGSSNVKAEVKNGQFNGAVSAATDGTIAVSGGTFSSEVPGNCCAPGFVPTQNGNTYGVEIKANMAAEVLDAQGKTVGAYDTLAAAITAAKNGDTVKLLKDVTEKVSISRNLVLDLNGKTLTGEDLKNSNGKHERIALTANAGKVEVKNGIIDGRVNAYDSADLTIDADVTVKNSYNGSGYDCFGIVVWGDGTFGQNGCKTPKLTVNGKVIMEKGGVAISTNGTDKSCAVVTINDGAVISTTEDGAIYLPSGKLTMNGGTVSGPTGIQICAGTADITADFKLNKGTVTATGTDQRTSKGTGDGLIPDGAAISVVNRNYPNGVPSVTINGGSFSSVNSDAVLAYTWSKGTASEWTDAKTYVKINDGYFTSDPSAYVVNNGSANIVKRDGSEGAYTYTVLARSSLTSGVYLTDPSGALASNYYVSSTANGVWTVSYSAPYSGGSSSYDPTYSVSTPSKTKNGSVTVSPKSASKGDRVTVTVKPDSGYVLETLTVTDKNGNELTLKDKGDGKYTFTMPAGKVEVKATFMEDNSMLNFFYDVPNNAYFYEAVKWAVKNGITTGVGNNLFAPEQPCTRAQIVTFLWRAAGSPEPKGAASGMTDVVSGGYYEKAVAWAIENGITTGTTTSMFSPDATCTRAQAVTFLARALKAKAASAAEFSDVPTGSYFADAVAWAAANGVTEGIGGGLFGSDNDCTRGQIVTFLYRAYNK